MHMFRLLALAATVALLAPPASAQNRATRALMDKDQEMTTGIPKVQHAPRGRAGRMSASERRIERLDRENDRTTGFATQGPRAPRGMAPNPSRLDRMRMQKGTEMDQERTTGIVVRRPR